MSGRTTEPAEGARYRAKLSRYRSPEGAHEYHAEYERKLHRKLSDRRERRIYRRFFRAMGRPDVVLDLPAGAGRLYEFLADRSGRVLEGDWSESMLALDRAEHAGAALGYVRCSGLAVPLRDGAVDATFSIRLSHHLPTQAEREAHLSELFRVTRGWVVVTWFSATSLKNVLRVLRRPLDRKPPKNVMRTSAVVALARSCGFERGATISLAPLGSGHVIGLFRRATI